MVEVQRHPAAEALGDGADLLHRLAHLEEQHVGAGLEVGLAALERVLQAVHHDRVAARDDHEIGVVPGVERGLDLARHLLRGDQALADHVAAALGPHLVLDMDAGHPGALELAHRARGVEGVAVAVVGVDDHRDAHRLGDVARVLHHLRHGDQADVRIAAAHGSAGAGHHAQRIADLLDDPRAQAVVGAAAEDDARRGQQLS
jgi:hypothetical protein